jgi:hypothetical protein
LTRGPEKRGFWRSKRSRSISAKSSLACLIVVWMILVDELLVGVGCAGC